MTHRDPVADRFGMQVADEQPEEHFGKKGRIAVHRDAGGLPRSEDLIQQVAGARRGPFEK